jgi:hypothetical protein
LRSVQRLCQLRATLFDDIGGSGKRLKRIA